MAATVPLLPLNLALITRRYPPLIGGAETMIRYLAQALADEGAAVTVVTSRFGAARSSPERERVERGSGSLQVVRLGTSPVRFVGTFLYMRRLRTWLKENAPDLAYVSMLKHDAYVAVGVGQERGFPVVLRPEGAGATGDVAWQAWGRFGRRIAQRCRQADQFVAISPPIHAELVAAGFDPTRVTDLPNGVPVPHRAWQRRDGWKEQPVAVSVGRLAPEKGHADLLAAWPAVRDKLPGARLVLLGDGPERPHLEELLTRHRLGESVTLAGPCADVEPHLRRADLFVLPSREEGMSVALLEAMALGMPLVATAIPGNRKLVADFKQGRLCRADDPSSLARTIVEQWGDMDRAIHMGHAARSLVQQRYAIAAVARQHLALFDRLIAERGSR
jgi:glycosyltransferase involved in cell wall biosynthesis